MAQKSKPIIVVISSAHSGYRRAGVVLSQGENLLDASQFTDAQIAMLQADPRLSMATGEVANPSEDGVSQEGTLVDDGLSDGLDKPQSLVDAIKLLDADNTEHFTSSGKPQVDALAKLMETPVSAAERDEAWEAFKAASSETTEQDGE